MPVVKELPTHEPLEFHPDGRDLQFAGPRRLGEPSAETLPRGSAPRSPKEARCGLVAHSPQMLDIIRLSRRVAGVDATVLITGDTGVGKERIARLIHDESPRAGGPFLAVNCAAITEALLESELFGHVRGAFTGATSEHQGLVEAAHGGTLLLDEIGEITPALQVKLLRLLQEREVRRVGETRARPVDVRFLAATNCDLGLAMDEGLFRRDLYYRLKVIEVRVPALRDRPEDILPLARRLLADACHSMARPMAGLSEAASCQIRQYDWPGNVRELENAMARGVALAAGDRIEVEDLPEEIRRATFRPVAAAGSTVRSLADVEKRYVLSVLELNEGNRTRTAEQLQIAPATLYRKLRSWKADAEACDSD